jgi:hypothetical protein
MILNFKVNFCILNLENFETFEYKSQKKIQDSYRKNSEIQLKVQVKKSQKYLTQF